uniref:ROK family protein n=1 Tax=uncultured Demequina sp. TaxID=693499 RepID=UPI0025F2B21D
WSEDPAALETGAYEHSVAGPTIGARVSAALGRPVDTPEVFDLAARGDAAALAALDEFARCAAVGIAAVVAVVDPPVIVLGGGIGRRSDLPSLIEPWLEHYGCGHVVLRTSSLGPSGPVIGAIQRARLHVIQEGLS